MWLLGAEEQEEELMFIFWVGGGEFYYIHKLQIELLVIVTRSELT